MVATSMCSTHSSTTCGRSVSWAAEHAQGEARECCGEATNKRGRENLVVLHERLHDNRRQGGQLIVDNERSQALQKGRAGNIVHGELVKDGGEEEIPVGEERGGAVSGRAPSPALLRPVMYRRLISRHALMQAAAAVVKAFRCTASSVVPPRPLASRESDCEGSCTTRKPQKQLGRERRRALTAPPGKHPRRTPPRPSWRPARRSVDAHVPGYRKVGHGR
jgi:hypothetical protein